MKIIASLAQALAEVEAGVVAKADQLPVCSAVALTSHGPIDIKFSKILTS